MDDFKQVMISDETHARLQALAKLDHRSMSGTIAWLIEQEMARRYSQPNPLISIEDAIKANAETPSGK